MSLARSLLRICACEALRPTAQLQAPSPQWPTSAGRLVYDSRLDPIDDLATITRKPIVVIYTDREQRKRIAQHGPMLYTATVDLVFDLSCVAAVTSDGVDLGTDAELESALDAIEDQISFALHFGPSGRLFRKMVKMPFLDWQSDPERSSEESARLAMRTVRARVDMREYCYEAVPGEARTGLDRLPPKLKDIAQALDGSSYGAAIAAALASAASAMPVRTDLDTVAMRIDVANPLGAQDGVPDIDVTAGDLQD